MSNWKPILSFTYPHEAHMVKNYLEAEGFNVIITDELTVQVNNFYSGAIGGVKLLINETDIERAVPILQEGGYLNKPEQEQRKISLVPLKRTKDKTVCPFCKSDNISKKHKPHFMLVLFYLILFVFLPIFKSTYICHVCEKEWKWVKQ